MKSKKEKLERKRGLNQANLPKLKKIVKQQKQTLIRRMARKVGDVSKKNPQKRKKIKKIVESRTKNELVDDQQKIFRVISMTFLKMMTMR